MVNLPRVPSDDVIDILSGVFYFFPNGQDKFDYNREEFQKFFSRKKEKYPVLLHKLKLEEYPIYKNILDIARDRLVFARKLEYTNGMKDDMYIITPACRKYFDEEGRLKIEKKGLLHQVKKLSEDFQKEFLHKS